MIVGCEIEVVKIVFLVDVFVVWVGNMFEDLFVLVEGVEELWCEFVFCFYVLCEDVDIGDVWNFEVCLEGFGLELLVVLGEINFLC